MKVIQTVEDLHQVFEAKLPEELFPKLSPEAGDMVTGYTLSKDNCSMTTPMVCLEEVLADKLRTSEKIRQLYVDMDFNTKRMNHLGIFGTWKWRRDEKKKHLGQFVWTRTK